LPVAQPPLAVVFDLDDTLIVEEAAARASLRAIAAVLGGVEPSEMERAVLENARRLWRSGPHYAVCRKLGFASWEGLWSDFSGCHPCVDELRTWAPSYRDRAWQAVVATLGVDDAAVAAELDAAFTAEQRQAHRVIDGAQEVVRALAERCRLGLLTNGPADIQRHKLDRTGLAECFDAVVISGEVGVGKPSSAVFELVLETLGVPATAAVMVGDNWERDVLGAAGAGLSAIWVRGDRDGPSPDVAVPSVATVRSLAELLGA
jgi:putative hydrolase of the HAD superfamily